MGDMLELKKSSFSVEVKKSTHPSIMLFIQQEVLLYKRMDGTQKEILLHMSLKMFLDIGEEQRQCRYSIFC